MRLNSSSFPKKQAYSHTEFVNHLSAQGTFDLEVASECFAAISSFAAGFHSRFQAPPSIPDSRASPHQVPQFSISGITPYFQNHGHIYEDTHAVRSRMPSKQTGLTDKAKLDHRIRAIQALVDFCKVQEAPRCRR